MDFAKLAEKLGLEKDEFIELVELFLDVSASDLGKLQSAIDERDIQQAVEVAHSLKGASGNLGLDEISRMAKNVEANARQGSLDGATEAVRMMKEKRELIAEAIKNA
ncbi:MAG: Hpt domain-containing protein [Deltaproteobacteria bacterium]|nr:Hpt domain-containing protein [Deltaproteobacteria bacterium]RLB89777.1 MAG: Hpt domain-containing protein [Deltaproteobacteria bacterium]RLB89839.1 MAG: Hpt domain-containing protein [Deltaproteobacteria bacterium]RLC08314.1 MAG: Hpt domain-containing protein [Deltaproteobacteria bacterium]